ncbi:FliM/FliN family flagellar motor switch protein [Veronia nyctiphanis]|uniref:FliM/FliN family flagellar motor switch protein n=1 Tax=Veronia nyctiphanis TaxID=1278244 RepID=UPI00100B483F|nr:FliM/FliN family flagellar motor switch protein [Veronia nyctiphanis]
MSEPITFRKMSTLEFDCLNKIANAAIIPVDFSDQNGALVLSTLTDSSDQKNWVWFNSKLGKLAIDQPELLFRVLSLLPVALPKALLSNGDSETKMDANAVLNAQFELKNALKYLVQGCGSLFEHLCPIKAFDTQCQLLQLDVIRGDKSAKFNLLLPYETLRRWLDVFAPMPRAFRGTLDITLPVILGELSLANATLKTLSAGDLIIPNTPLFNADGTGVFCVGSQQWSVASFSENHKTGYKLLNYQNVAEGITMSDDNQHDPNETEAGPPAFHQNDDTFGASTSPEFSPSFDANGDGFQGMPGTMTPEMADNSMQPNGPEDNFVSMASADAAEPGLGSIMLELTIRHGHVNVPLNKLSQLVPGDVLLSEDAHPGEAALYYKERPIAKGELVEVNQRLALKITHVDFE